jgi:hypothetical protein
MVPDEVGGRGFIPILKMRALELRKIKSKFAQLIQVLEPSLMFPAAIPVYLNGSAHSEPGPGNLHSNSCVTNYAQFEKLAPLCLFYRPASYSGGNKSLSGQGL